MEGEGAFVYAGWNGDPAVEAKVKEDTKATIRCIPLDETDAEAGACIVCGDGSSRRVVFARAY